MTPLTAPSSTAPSSAAPGPAGTAVFSPGRKRPWILPMNNPPVVSVADAHHMRPDDAVIGVVVNGRARAYPWWIAANYHVVNDSIIVSDEPAGYLWSKELGNDGKESYAWFDHVPLLITICEACTGVSAFDTRLDDGSQNPLVFGICDGGPPGAYRAVGTFTISDLETRTRWHPLTGRAMDGPLRGSELPRLPAFTERWDVWSADHPDTDVAYAGAEMRARPHVLDLPAVDDPQAAHTSLRVARATAPASIDHRLEHTTMVLGVGDAATDHALAHPLDALRAAGGVVQRDFEGTPCVFLLQGDFRGLVLSRLLDGEVLDFERVGRAEQAEPVAGAPGGSPFLRDASGTLWDGTGRAVSGPLSGRQLRLMPDSYVSKWSEWSLAHPGAVIVGTSDTRNGT